VSAILPESLNQRFQLSLFWLKAVIKFVAHALVKCENTKRPEPKGTRPEVQGALGATNVIVTLRAGRGNYNIGLP
jgi:hypothetical protein